MPSAIVPVGGPDTEGIELDDWGYPILRPGTIPAELQAIARQAVEVCPVLALRLVAATSPEHARAAERVPAPRALART